MTEQIVGTLYGVGAITEVEAGGASRRRRCLYFSESAFHRYPDVDGAIIVGPAGAAFHMNDYGRRFDRVRQSQLACFFAQQSAFYDKHAMESQCDCLVADFAMDRRDPHAVVEQLNQKYPNLKLQFTKWHRYEAFGGVFPLK